MKPNEKIRNQRLVLGLTDVQVATQAGMSIDEFFDIELHEDELVDVTPISDVKRLCCILGLDLLELFGRDCEFCSEELAYDPIFGMPRRHLIAASRTKLGYSTDALAEELGFEVQAIVSMESDDEFLDTWTLDLLETLSEKIKAPIQVLMGVRCRRCGR